jgi:DNA-directed RNA polymerase specialized sigma24 family protein
MPSSATLPDVRTRQVNVDRSALLHPTLEVVYAVAYSFLPEALRRRRLPVHDVEDLIHDVVLVAQRKLGRFQTDEQDPLGALRGWLWVIAWHRASHLRGTGAGRYEVLEVFTAVRR